MKDDKKGSPKDGRRGSPVSASSNGHSVDENEGSNEDIVVLKNRLNEALRKSSNLASDLSDMAEKNEANWQPPVLPHFNKYGTKPILSVDVNLGEGISDKIIVYEGESSKTVSDRLAAKFTISEETKQKF